MSYITSQNVYSIIIFMIIKKISNFQSPEALLKFVQARKRRHLLFTNSCNYQFSQDPKDDKNNDNQKKQMKITTMRNSDYKKDLNKANPKLIKSYMKRLGFANMSSPIFRQLDSLTRVLGYLQGKNSHYTNSNEESKSEYIFPLKTLISKVGALLLIFYISSLLKRQNNKPEENQIITQINTNESEEIGSLKLEETILNLSKVYIYSSSNMDRSEDSDESQESSNPDKHSQRVKLVTYRIVMIDKDGKQYVADPYHGDPNNFLKYVEAVQDKYHKTERVDVFFDNKEAYTISNAFSSVFGLVASFIPVAITIYLFRRMDPTALLKNFGKGAKQFKIEAMKDIKTRFKDVAGMEQAKKEITEFVDFLKNNEKYKQMGAKIPKGALLTGPPGTGKTMLARACAGEAGVSFFYISGSQFVQVFVGLGASKVRDLFAKARQNAPSIIFIDEIDAIGKKRETSRNEEKDSTLNQLLVEMDGFSSSQTIVVLAATNRKQILDNALTRPGRFDRMVQITLPDVKARQQIFMVHLSPLKIDPNTDMKTVAKRLSELSPGFSGADIANLCNEAAIIATRKDRNFITEKDFEEATERITAGYVKKNLMKQKTKKRVAYHEAGHAVSSWFLKGGDPLVKLTIIPRSKGALGYAQYLPKASFIMARDELIDKIAIMLGGITSEEIFFGQISSGGSDDLQKVYSLTRRMVTQFGMGKQTYNMTIDEESYIQKQSTFLTNKMEEEVESILQEAKKRSRQIIESKRDIIEALANELMTKETLNSAQILALMGERPDFVAGTKKSEILI